MKLLFVHDHPFFKDENGCVYSGGGLPSKIWNNYLLNFDSVLVYGRRSYKEKDKKIISSFEKVNFCLTDYYTSTKSYFLNRRKILEEIKSLVNEADVVLVRLPSFLGFLAANVAKEMNKKVWVEQVGSAKEALASHGSFIGLLGSNYFEYKNKLIVKNADFVSYVTKFKLQKDYPIKKHTITCSISNVFIDEILNSKDIDKSRFFNRSLKIGLIGGFDVKYKGQDVLLKAISCLEDDIKERIEISFVGKGDYQWVLDLATELNLVNKIVFIGSLEAGEQIKTELKTLGLYIQASLTEGMPRATIEAMAMGCPVIGSNVGGIPDVVTKDYVHQKGDYKKLSNDIKVLFTNRDKLENESYMSISKAQEFSLENIIRKRKEFYNSINNTINK